jgi:hypothetical protein
LTFILCTSRQEKVLSSQIRVIVQVGLMTSFCYNSIWRRNPIVTRSIRRDQFVTCSIPKDANGA